jgi:hypothetical protein
LALPTWKNATGLLAHDIPFPLMQKRKYPEYSGWLYAVPESQPLTHPITTHKHNHHHPKKTTTTTPQQKQMIMPSNRIELLTFAWT